MELGEFKKALKGRKLMVWITWQTDASGHRCDGDYVEMSKRAFLKGIGADVSYERDGLHSATQIDARIHEEEEEEEGYIMVG